REQQPAGRGHLAARSRLPLGGVNPERLEELAPRKVRKRLGESTFERDPEEHDACGAVAETTRRTDGQRQREGGPVLLRIHPLLVARRRLVPVIAVEARAHGEDVADGDAAL